MAAPPIFINLPLIPHRPYDTMRGISYDLIGAYRMAQKAEFSTEGDTVYLAIYSCAPKKIILLCPSKTHNYQA